MDQNQYLMALKPVSNHLLTGSKAEDALPEPLQKQFLSLLMALAFALQTRLDLGVYVVALQRIAHEPTYAHLRKLNALVRWALSNPLSLFDTTECDAADILKYIQMLASAKKRRMEWIQADPRGERTTSDWERDQLPLPPDGHATSWTGTAQA